MVCQHKLRDVTETTKANIVYEDLYLIDLQIHYVKVNMLENDSRVEFSVL